MAMMEAFMVATSENNNHAVIFFAQNQITHEMLYSEFEAILDRFVPFPDKANSSSKAVFIRINPQLKITAAVFFLINFDKEGFIDKRWNIPLERLADSAARGPDLGAGPIKLCCQSQCAVDWHQQQLWDPDMTPGVNNFVLLRKAVERNRLTLVYKPEEEMERGAAAEAPVQQIVEPKALEAHLSQHLHRQYEQKFRDRMAQLLKEQRLRMLTMNSQHRDKLHQLKREHQHRLEIYEERVSEAVGLLAEEQQRNQQLKQNIEAQAKKVEGVREYFELKLKTAKTVENSHLHALKVNYEMELAAKVEAATTELKEMLQMREVELVYRSEQEESLRDEVTRLRQENQQFISNSGDKLLEKLSQSGVTFVAFHQGVGHVTIPLVDMPNYLESPTAFAAECCGMTERQYADWLEHYKNPHCQALDEHGKVCGKNIERIESPGDFHLGESDRCGVHLTDGRRTFATIK